MNADEGMEQKELSFTTDGNTKMVQLGTFFFKRKLNILLLSHNTAVFTPWYLPKCTENLHVNA
jgi:hypothetical protein